MKKLLRNPFLLIISLFAVVLLTITSATLAKYYTEKEINNNQTTADKFYFTVDILGDTNSDDSLIETFNLYGEGEKVFTFKVQNFFDLLRINEDAITYDVSLSSSDNEYTPTLSSSSAEYSFTNSKEAQSNVFNLTLPEGFKNGTTVTIDIMSTSPYTKTMSLIFVLHTYDYEVAYYIEDTAKSPYASLIITTYVDIPVGKLTVDWSSINVVNGVNENILQVDTTNPYLLDNVDGVLTLQTNKPAVGTYMTSFVNTIAINAGEAIKINFFKSDASLDYTKSKVIINDDDGTYTITLN